MHSLERFLRQQLLRRGSLVAERRHFRLEARSTAPVERDAARRQLDAGHVERACAQRSPERADGGMAKPLMQQLVRVRLRLRCHCRQLCPLVESQLVDATVV